MDNIDELLTRGVEKIYPTKEELEKVLRSGKKLKLYQGFDPTGDKLHIGHLIGLRKLRKWQDLGHHVIFLIGTATVQAGDPSGKKSARGKLRNLLIESKEDKPGILRKIAEAFEIEEVNMTAIDSQIMKGVTRFKVGIDKNSPTKFINKAIKLLTDQGFTVIDESHKFAKDYAEQAKKIINFGGENPAEILYNADWLNQLSFVDVLNLIGHFSLQQLLERDLFQERIKKDEEINLREFLYPVMQAYDSVAMDVDLEIGGSDQTFNMLMGRRLVKEMLHKNKFVMTTPLITDSQGVKIGKSEGNVIGLTDEPNDLFGKIMALPDDIIVRGFEYLTDVPMEEIKNIEKKISSKENPVQYKKRLAFEIVKQLHSEKSAKEAQIKFGEGQFSDIQIAKYPDSALDFYDFLIKIGATPSRSEAKRLKEQGGITVDGKNIQNENVEKITNGSIVEVKIGKRKTIKIEY